mmetsp:Transcript_3070/g.8149  ORF Transcript_3070/g.8149 Transcript_3070/m.8149 type:complete len:237 (+) Transcript_3070:233-943(+)
MRACASFELGKGRRRKENLVSHRPPPSHAIHRSEEEIDRNPTPSFSVLQSPIGPGLRAQWAWAGGSPSMHGDKARAQTPYLGPRPMVMASMACSCSGMNLAFMALAFSLISGSALCSSSDCTSIIAPAWSAEKPNSARTGAMMPQAQGRTTIMYCMTSSPAVALAFSISSTFAGSSSSAVILLTQALAWSRESFTPAPAGAPNMLGAAILSLATLLVEVDFARPSVSQVAQGSLPA